MMRTFLLVGLSSLSCGNGSIEQGTPDEWIKVEVDPAIVAKAETRFTTSEFDVSATNSAGMIYNNLVDWELFENDVLVTTDGHKEGHSTVFKSFYFWRGDTLEIDGGYGLFGGSGFSALVRDGQTLVRHLLAADENPSYSYGPNDALRYRLEVPCTKTRLVLSQLPDTAFHGPIHGYVEFNSADFYSAGGRLDEEGNYLDPRKKFRDNARIYFRSVALDMSRFEKP